jgi:transposase
MYIRFDLSDCEWKIIEALPPPTRQGGERTDDRRVFNGIFYVLRTGIPWVNVPSRYGPPTGPPTTIYNRFRRWAKQGIWQQIFDELQNRNPRSIQTMGATLVAAHRAAEGAGKEDSPVPSAPKRRRSAARAGAAPLNATASSKSAAGCAGSA